MCRTTPPLCQTANLVSSPSFVIIHLFRKKSCGISISCTARYDNNRFYVFSDLSVHMSVLAVDCVVVVCCSQWDVRWRNQIIHHFRRRRQRRCSKVRWCRLEAVSSTFHVTMSHLLLPKHVTCLLPRLAVADAWTWWSMAAVTLCVRASKDKRLGLLTTNLADIYSIAGHGYALTLESKGQRSRL